jgi:transposase
MIPPEDSVRLLSQIMEELDYRKLYEAYSRIGRKAAVSPKNLFKILVYGYMNGFYSSRSIEKACRRDIHFMWLLEGQSSPDHNTIVRFRTQLVVKLGQKGEIAYENLFVDGTQIEANANKYSFVWKKAITKHVARLKIKIGAFILQTNPKYGSAFSADSPLELVQVFFEIDILCRDK